MKKFDKRRLALALCAVLMAAMPALAQQHTRSATRSSTPAAVHGAKRNAKQKTQTADQKAAQLRQRIQKIAARPLFRRSTFGVEVYDLNTKQVLVAMNQDKLFTPGSTTKVITEGAALALLGPEYRFHTRVYATGDVTRDGTLNGDVILVASGDPNLSGRVENDKLDFTAFDHSYAGVLPGISVPGDPLQVFKELAIGVLRSGIWRIHGRVLVDASMFPSTHVEPATHATVSPVVLNDNVIDVHATSVGMPGGPVSLEVMPDLPYLKVINKVRTGGEDSDAELRFTSDVAAADGSHTVVLEGTVPAGFQKAQAAYKVKDPVLYATVAFREALRWAHVEVDEPDVSAGAAGGPASAAAKATTPLKPKEGFHPDKPTTGLSGTPGLNGAPSTADAAAAQPERGKLLVEHISPPFREEVKLTLKVSQNLHAATTPYLLGAILAHASDDAFAQGLQLERRFLIDAGLDPESVSQLDGEGGMGSAFTPDFMVRYLAYMSRQPYGKLFFNSLPVLGRDGTLAEMLDDSRAAGHVHAKTGSYVVANALDAGVMLLGKGLVGYVDAQNGHQLILAVYVNMVPLHDMNDVAEVGETLADIAAMAYQYAPKPAATAQKPASRKAPKRTQR